MLSKVLNRILPQNIYNALLHLNADKLYELRIRGESVVTVGYGSGYYYLTPHGTSAVSENAINVRKEEIEQIVIRACEKSMYAVNDKLRNGFLTLDGGIRLGITGETVFENGSIKTIKNSHKYKQSKESSHQIFLIWIHSIKTRNPWTL